MLLQGLKRKEPNARHFFMYRLNGQVYSGLKPDYLQNYNTVIRPDIDVASEVRAINQGIITAPQPISRAEINQVRFVQSALIIGMILISLFWFKPWSLGPGNFHAGRLLGGVVIFGLIMLHERMGKRISKYQSDENQIEWEINGRVYGEHRNENGENVLYPKRGDGFYTLSPLEYLKLYTLQLQNGDLLKSDVLFQNLRKALVQERKIATTDVLTLADQNKVMGIYVEFCNTAVL
jgi:hypothetical protein